ncbi:MAG TPA: OmpA family protein [Burkholderiales bacterium]|nr:OmpA family protein [Burkholderiales bacterium]
MRFHAPAIITASLILGACAQSTERTSESIASARPQPVVASQPIEPEAVQPVPVHNDMIVLLPKPNGQIGGVIVRGVDGGDELLLKTAYAGAHIDGSGKVQSLTYDAESAKQEFGTVITALPSRPATFTLYFLEAKDELTPESESEVARIFAELQSRPDPEIWVIGHTDAVGTVQYNDQLSLQRAERVRDDLVSRGIPADSIDVSGRGKREPLVPTSEGISEAKNRRVEISVR